MFEVVLHDVTGRLGSGDGMSGISLRVASGEFLVLLGPSGCGKSTLLRLIAGLEHREDGEIEIGGARAAVSRDMIAMVFQNFALYPHMSTFNNIAFLRLCAVAHRPRFGARPRGDPDGRAAFKPRCDVIRRAQAGAQGIPAPHRPRHRVRGARPGRGARTGRPDRGDAQRATALLR